jgi:glycosyltransferase involved in cell wall biosynthesis
VPDPVRVTDVGVPESRVARLRGLAIVPAYNEQTAIGSVLAEIKQADPELQVVVVDDGSFDRTAMIAEREGALVLRLPFNLGIGGAVQTGYRYALENGFDVAVQIDGDGQHVPEEVERLLEPIRAQQADIVIGSRFAARGSYRATRGRRLGQRVFAGIVSAIVGQSLTDTSSSFRAVNRNALRLFAADYPHGYLESVEATVLAAKHGLRIVEVPVHMREREAGSSSLTVPRSLFYSLKVLVALFVGLFRGTTVPRTEEMDR